MRSLTPIHVPGLGAEVVHVRDLREAGVKHWRVNASDLKSPMRGTRVRPDIDGTSFLARAQAMQLLLGEGRFLSRRSAARLMLIPASERLAPLKSGP